MTKGPEIEDTPVWVLPNKFRLGWVPNTKFGTDVSNKMLLNTEKFQSYNFNRFWVIKGKPSLEITAPLSPQIRFKKCLS